MSRAVAALFSLMLIAAADGPPPAPDSGGPLPHASGTPSGPGRNCGGGYTVAPGDTLYSIARRCDNTVEELIQVNELGRQPRLVPGQDLAIGVLVDPHNRPYHLSPPVEYRPPPPPSAVRPLPRLAPPPPPARQDRRGPPPPPREAGNIYHFQAGDTLYSLARWARTSLAALRAANPDIDPRDVEVGDPIRLPPGAVWPEPLRARERGGTAPVVSESRLPDVRPAPPRPPEGRPAPPPRPMPRAVPPRRDDDDADKPKPDDEDEDDGPTPGGMDDGGPEPDGM